MSWVCIDMKKERKEKCCSCGRLERQGHVLSEATHMDASISADGLIDKIGY